MPRGGPGLRMELQYIDGAGASSCYTFVFLAVGLFKLHDYHDDGF
jgi:hypothetical protein